MKVEELVGKLLMRTNCVIIPDFGGFISNSKSAYIDYSKGVVYPPTKSVTFNKSLINNDGLLINEFGKLTGLDYIGAHEEVTTFVRHAKRRLKAGERITIENVGFLYTDSNGSLRFEQDRFFNLLMEAYGMGAVQFIPDVESESEKERVTRLPEKEVVDAPIVALTPKKKRSTLNKVVKYAAAAALVPVLFYSFWIPTHTDVLRSGVLFKDDFNPLKKSTSSLYLKKDIANTSIDNLNTEEAPFKDVIDQLPASVSVYSFQLNEDTFIPVKLTRNAVKETEEAPSSINQYHLIAGCFSNKSNAEKLVEELAAEGLNAYIVDFHKGLHRVSVVQSPDKIELESTRTKLMSKGFSSWILKK